MYLVENKKINCGLSVSHKKHCNKGMFLQYFIITVSDCLKHFKWNDYIVHKLIYMYIFVHLYTVV